MPANGLHVISMRDDEQERRRRQNYGCLRDYFGDLLLLLLLTMPISLISTIRFDERNEECKRSPPPQARGLKL